MLNFILGLVCGIALTLLTPWANDNILHGSGKKTETYTPAASAPPASANDWMYDKSRGTLNQPASKTK